MLDHVTIKVSDIARSFAGYGVGTKAFFWIGANGDAVTGAHVAFAVDDRAAIERFHAVGLSAGGIDNGIPGVRPHYHPNYYGTFILDPDGHNIEAVCHRPV